MYEGQRLRKTLRKQLGETPGKMTKTLPSLALDMSQDGIVLHQLAFDGHWHELARVELTDAALRERLSNMRSIASKLDGRRFKVRIWLPAEQIISKNLRLEGADDSTRPTKAIAAYAAAVGGKPGELSVRLGGRNDDGTYAVAGVRLRTLQEARIFAKSHGFRARGYSSQTAVEGFLQPPEFDIPVNKVKIVGLGALAATTAALVLGGGYAFYKLDPLNMWELAPRAADFAPFQQPDPGIERAGASALPGGLGARPRFPALTTISTNSARFPLPYLPPRQLTAVAQETVTEPQAPKAGGPAAALVTPVTVAVNWPAAIAPLAPPSGADTPPSLGLITLMGRIADLQAPAADTPPPPPRATTGFSAGFSAPPRPVTVANTAFFLEPLPAMATRLSPASLAAFAARTGLSMTQLSTMAQPILLIESKLVRAIPDLPPILPRLRSGRAIPPQVAPPATPPVAQAPPRTTPLATGPTTPDQPAALFNLVSGRPDILPAKRPTRPEAATLAAGAPPGSEADSAAVSASIALSSAVNAAIESVAPPNNLPFSLLNGQPALLPLLRSGSPISPRVVASAPAADILPATAAANALRPLRRVFDPQAPATPIDPMISGAAPVVAVRPGHRNTAFTANVARIIAATARRPRTTAPSVPRDPQSVNLPTSASVARAATIENALNLRKTNLLGIFGTADNRTALIMLSGGRMVRVSMGQSFSGWTVVAISANTVRIRKRKREEILRMPAE